MDADAAPFESQQQSVRVVCLPMLMVWFAVSTSALTAWGLRSYSTKKIGAVGLINNRSRLPGAGGLQMLGWAMRAVAGWASP